MKHKTYWCVFQTNPDIPWTFTITEMKRETIRAFIGDGDGLATWPQLRRKGFVVRKIRITEVPKPIRKQRRPAG